MKGLSEKQRAVLRFIREFIEENEYAPSFREIARAFGLKSLSTIHKHIQSLIRKGHLEMEERGARSLALPKSGEKLIAVPIVGTFSLEKGIVMEREVSKHIDLPRKMAGPHHYILVAAGKKLESVGYWSGDLLVVEPREEVFKGEMAICAGPSLMQDPPPSIRVLAALIFSIRFHHAQVQSRQGSLTCGLR